MVNVTDDTSITIREIQHYIYCPHRWGLMAIGNAWAENYFVTKANLLHTRVHNPDNHYVRKNVKVFTGVEIFNDTPEINIHGAVDCLELKKDTAGVPISGENSKYSLTIVEYKPTQPKGKECNYDDIMQVFAQKICVDYTFKANASGVIYYADTKKRIKLPLQENYDEYFETLTAVLTEMRVYLAAGIIPAKPKKQRCSGCSMKDLCMQGKHNQKPIRDMILETLYA